MLNTQARPLHNVHAAAIVDPSAELGAGVVVGPYSIIGPNVVIGEGTRLASHVLVERDTVIGRDCVIHHGAVLGSDPQDLKFEGETAELRVGDRTVIREYATLNRGTAARGCTEVGDDCLIMAYAHVAHDCVIRDHVVLSNTVNMGGHVQIDEWAIVGGMTAIHQFVRIGCHAFIGGASRVPKDVPPYVRVAGNAPQLYGLNTVGLDRRGFTEEVRRELKRTYRLFFHSSLNVSQALEHARYELKPFPEVIRFLDFVQASERGILV